MEKRFISKWVLYRNSMLGPFVFSISGGIFLFIIMQMATLFSPNATYEWLESIFFGMYIGMIAFLLLFFIFTLSPIRGLFQLAKQEKVLNISFSEDMVKHNITETIYKNYQWFINTNAVTIVAIRRDYIEKIHKIKDPNGKKARLIVTLITSNGKKLKLSGSYHNIKKFENWYLQKDRINK